MIGFDVLQVNSGTGNYTVKRKTQNTGFTFLDLSLVKIGAFATNSLVPQPNFYRLETLTGVNTVYADKDLNSTSPIIPSATQLLLFEPGKAFSCQTNNFLGKTFFLFYKDASTFACASNCPATTSVYPGNYAFLSTANKGICNWTCPGVGITINSCPNTAAQLGLMSTAYPALCKANYIDYGYLCQAQSVSSALQPSKRNLIIFNCLDSLYYSNFYTSQTILIDTTVSPFSSVLSGLKSYIIEIWFYLDNIVPLPNLETNLAKKNYVFFSNAFRLYWDYTNPLAKVYILEYNYGINSTFNVPVGMIISNAWNKL